MCVAICYIRHMDDFDKNELSHLLLLLSFYRIPPTLCSTRISTVYQRLCHSTIRMFYAHLTHFYQRPFGLPCSRLTKYVIPTLFRALFRLVVSVIISQCTKYHQRTKRFPWLGFSALEFRVYDLVRPNFLKIHVSNPFRILWLRRSLDSCCHFVSGIEQFVSPASLYKRGVGVQ